jgi:phosphoribosylformimino-5-aminoimidazole carboxamide ribotide isomerase
MIIIPAIDIIEGKCVRLTKGDYNQKTIYGDDPLEVAKMFQDWGLKHLHLVDLDGAKEKHIVNRKVLEKLAQSTSLCIDFGGGIKSNEDIRIAFDSGAARVTGGSIAVQDPDLFLSWLEKYGSDKIIRGADHRDGFIASLGWTQKSSNHVFEFIAEYRQKGIVKVICTDISRDGTLAGPSTDLYARLLEKNRGLYLIASGGVSRMEDIYELKEAGLNAAIVGKAIYEQRITEKEISNYLENL